MITLESVGKGLRIAGEWRGAKDGTELQVIDPGKETPLAKVADAGVMADLRLRDHGLLRARLEELRLLTQADPEAQQQVRLLQQ
mgnify:CR=1 FL=1